MLSVYCSLFVFMCLFVSHSFGQIKIDCHPGSEIATAGKCAARNCVWSPTSRPMGIPWCYFPANIAAFPGYIAKYNPSALTAKLNRRSTPSLFGNDYNTLEAKFESVNANTFRFRIGPNLKTAEKHDKHPEVRKLKKYIHTSAEANQFNISVIENPFGIRIQRASNNMVLFDSTNLPGLTFSKQFIQISTRVPTRNVYGIGEQYHMKLRRKFDWKCLSIFTRDQAPYPNMDNLYGSHPFYMGLDGNNQSFGVYFHNSHGMNIQFQPDPDLITFRVIGGIVDFFIFIGPTADEVVQQYTKVVGRPFFPPYWSLGFQLSRYGYTNLTYLRNVWNRNRRAHIPQDVQITDIDYMHEKFDFTYDKVRYKNFPEFIDEIHADGRKWIPIIDPGIPSGAKNYSALTDGLKQKIFIMDSRTGKPLEGKVWPGKTYFPDFTHPKAASYWSAQLAKFHRIAPFDGIWLDMNDPSNFVSGSVTGCRRNSLNYPPYSPVSYSPIFTKTICLDSRQYKSFHYEWHNFYGFFESMATHTALTKVIKGKRPFVLSRSTSPGSGKFTAHWSGDNQATWQSLNHSLIALLEFSMFGIPMMGSDICGFGKDTTEELCLRWSQVGSFYPYCRNHNSIDSKTEQDPAAWPANTTNAIRDALKGRYAMLPYLYTLLYHSHVNGSTVVRPLFFEYPYDSATWDMYDQFLWGKSLMVVPILQKFSVTRNVYFPKGVWYDIRNFLAPVPGATKGRSFTANIPKNAINLYVRGGSIIPGQTDPDESTSKTRLNPLTIVVGPDGAGGASGDLFWDDGESILDKNKCCLVKFTMTSTGETHKLTIKAKKFRCENIPPIGFLFICNVARLPVNMTLNGVPIREKSVVYQADSKKLMLITDITIKNKTDTIRWIA